MTISRQLGDSTHQRIRLILFTTQRVEEFGIGNLGGVGSGSHRQNSHRVCGHFHKAGVASLAGLRHSLGEPDGMAHTLREVLVVRWRIASPVHGVLINGGEECTAEWTRLNIGNLANKFTNKRRHHGRVPGAIHWQHAGEFAVFGGVVHKSLYIDLPATHRNLRGGGVDGGLYRIEFAGVLGY